MLSTAIAAWRNLVKRLSVDWLIVTAGTVTILLAMALLAAGPIYADAVTESSLRRTLGNAPVADSTVVVAVRTPPNHYATVDQIASDAISKAFDGVDIEIDRVLDAEALEIEGYGDEETVALAQVRAMEHIETHATLIDGAWPVGVEETAVSETVAGHLDLAIGDTLLLADRRDRDRRTRVELVGVFRPFDDNDAYWLGEELITTGVVESGGFRTYGPFIIDSTALAALTPRANASWRAHPDYATLEVVETAAVRGRVAALPQRLGEALATVDDTTRRFSEFTVETGLDRLLAGTARSLSVTRSSVLALLIQLAILAGYALALTAGLLVETRRTETALLSARGASPRQVLAVAALEGLVLTIPAASAAPWLAARTLEWLVSAGPLATVGLDVSPVVNSESLVIVLGAALAAVFALAWPAWRSARAVAGSNGRSRQRARSGAQRAGVDIALVGLAVLAFWQLRSLGEVSATIQGRFGVDPVLIAAPTLGLLAGSVLALRIVPLIARLAERLAASGRGSVSALSAWQVARRPLRYARSALLLIMAVGIGFFAASYSSTWLDSQRDQADFQVGADVRAQPDRRTGAAISELRLVAAHESLEAVTRSMPVVRRTGTLPGSESTAEFLLLDAGAAADVVRIRDDLSPDFASLAGQLSDLRPSMAGITVPGKPERLGVVISATEELETESGEPLEPAFLADLALVVQDGDGLLHRLDFGEIGGDEDRRVLDVDLFTELDDGSISGPAFPLRVVAVEIASRFPPDKPRIVTFDLVEFVVDDGDGAWRSIAFDRDPETWMEELATVGQLAFLPAITESAAQPEEGLRLEIDTGVGFQGLAFFGIRPSSPAPAPYPVLVSRSWLESNNRQIGEETILESLATGQTRAVIAGAVTAFPSTSGGDVVVLDLPTFQVLKYAPGAAIVEADEHWLAVSGDSEPVVEALRSAPFEAGSVVSRSDRFLDLSSDPVALGTIGALSIGFLAAAVFAAVGFAVSATVSARERITEFGLLRALGLSPRQLGTWMSLEQGLLVLSSLVFGTVVGWALTRYVLPLVSVTQQGARPLPDVVIAYPWEVLFLVQAGLVAVLAVIVLVMTLLLRRLGLGSLLRLGEE